MRCSAPKRARGNLTFQLRLRPFWNLGLSFLALLLLALTLVIPA